MKNICVVPRPWIPMKVDETKNGLNIELWGRNYKIENSVLFSSMKTQGKELLSSPMRVVSSENGKPSVWKDSQVFLMSDSNESKVNICATSTSDNFYINTALNIEYDGCIKIDVKVMPRGITPREVMFLQTSKRSYNLDYLWLEIPLKKEVANLYQIAPRIDLILDNGTVKEGNFLSSADFVPKGTTRIGQRVGQFMLCNDDVGMGIFMEHKKNWQPIDENSYIECISKEDEVVLRLRLLDSHPKAWKHSTPAEECDRFFPLSFTFGMQVLPVRPFSENPYTEHNVHIDCFKKLDNDYEEYLSSKFVYDDGTVTDEKVFDRLQRLGVNTLYLHEKWNTCQNSFVLSNKSADRIKYIVSECHKRGMKVIPYFGYEISSLMPMYNDYADEMAVKDEKGNFRSFWNRVPYQRATPICQNSDWADKLSEGIDKLMTEYGFDGLYLDGTATPSEWGCANTNHGCGYYDHNGELRTTYQYFAARELLKKLYLVVSKHSGKINFHTGASDNIAALPFCHSIWDGETAQFSFITGEVEKMPEGLFRTIFTGRQFGIPIFFLCYINEPVWKFNDALTFSLLNGILPKTVDLDIPLETMSKIWEVTDKFPIANSQWKPYYNNDNGVVVSDSRVKCSYYEYVDLFGNRNLLAFIGNITKDKIVDVNISFGDNAKVKDLLNDSSKIIQGNVKCDFDSFGHYIFAISVSTV